ncbi:FAD/NADP-binding domain-containing protein [Dacryopinax primogenitus]|uniref:FAD/NADP-binding domain-containing protein n=1 Tax=Dacryopinax primogenitus (strain DJM 731) TaxID=1858805 RepID=M5FRJ3_DACPD|nr:FAD/NADP-binding domain-containing protein [Dacryopinax primogenitus]EJT99770.1 FAD/NADP-binding domain-containing protein [Dacryopinax primogenitus]
MTTSSAPITNGVHPSKPNIVVVGGSYVGGKAVEFIAAAMHNTHKVVLVEKNSHFQHLFAFPRFAILPGHEHMAFIPYKAEAFLNPGMPPGVDQGVLKGYTGPTPSDAVEILQATVTEVLPDKVLLEPGKGSPAPTELPYEYLVIATGTRLPSPGTLHIEGKAAGIAYFQEYQEQTKNANNIAIIGAGAIGVQMATDVKEYYPNKHVTLIHSRSHLMNKFHPKMHELILTRCKELGIDVILEDRVIVPEGGFPVGKGEFNIKLKSGKTIKADCAILCTGQVPLSGLLRPLSPSSITPSGHIHVKPALQLDDPNYPKIFAIGDVADTGGQKAARPGFKQAIIVAKNIKTLADAHGGHRWYKGDPSGIHLTLGMVRTHRNVLFQNPPFDTPDAEPRVNLKDDGHADMGVKRQWRTRAPGITDYYA